MTAVHTKSLSNFAAVTAAAEALHPAERDRLIRHAKLLAWSSLLWMTAEGIIALVAGIAANSIALIGFGIDSGIEGLACSATHRRLVVARPR